MAAWTIGFLERHASLRAAGALASKTDPIVCELAMSFVDGLLKDPDDERLLVGLALVSLVTIDVGVREVALNALGEPAEAAWQRLASTCWVDDVPGGERATVVVAATALRQSVLSRFELKGNRRARKSIHGDGDMAVGTATVPAIAFPALSDGDHPAGSVGGAAGWGREAQVYETPAGPRPRPKVVR